MYNYRIKMSSPEGGPEYILCHDKKFTQTEIHEMFCLCVFESMIKYLQEEIPESRFKLGETKSWPVPLEKFLCYLNPELEDIVHIIIEQMCLRFDFHKPQIEETLILGGWSYCAHTFYEESKHQSSFMLPIRDSTKKAIKAYLASNPDLIRGLPGSPDWLIEIVEGGD